MSVDIAIHPLSAPLINGQLAPAPVLQAGGQKSLAVDTNSNAIQGPCIIYLTSTTKKRLDIRRANDIGALDPANSGIVLPAELPMPFTLTSGSWILKTTAWA